VFENHVIAIAHWLDGFHDWQIYIAIASITFLENIFPPFPGDVLTVFSGIYVRQGRIDFFPAYIWSVIGATAGYYSLFMIFRGFSHLLNRPFAIKLYPEAERQRVHILFGRYGGWLIAVNRFFSGVRSIIALVGAIAGFPRLTFLLLTVLSCAIYNYTLLLLGWAIGAKVHKIDQMLLHSRRVLETFGMVPIVLTVAVTIFIVFYFIRMHRKGKES